jgi:hypothetical protein
MRARVRSVRLRRRASTPRDSIHHHEARGAGAAPPALPACPGYQTQYGCQAHSPTFGLPPKGIRRPPTLTTTGVTMYDSITLSTIPARPSAVGGYLSGHWPTFRPLVAAFPRAAHVPIAIFATPVHKSLVGRMSCLDIEPGDATPSQAGFWSRGELALGVKPCLYASLSTMSAVRASLAAAGVQRSRVFLWDADWTFSSHIDAGYDATQWTDHALNRNLDASLTTKAFLGVNPPPLPRCFTHRMTRADCNARRGQIAKAQRASASSHRAFKARGCAVLSQRVSWYTTQLRRHPATLTAARRRALRASRAAYRQRSCHTFAQRERFFDRRVVEIRAAS